MIHQTCGSILRHLAGERPYVRRLPADLGSTPVYVSARTDIRLLYWDLTPAAGDLFEIARTCIQPGDVVWDIGANLGLFSFAAAAKAGPHGKVLSVEPDTRHAELILRSRSRIKPGYAPIEVLCTAISNRQGIATLEISSRGHARNHLSEVAGNEAGQPIDRKSVTTVTLDWLLDHYPAPQMLKIDVEGAECLVLEGATRLLTSIRPTLYIEVSDIHLTKVTQLLKQHRYQLLDPATHEELASCTFNTLARPLPS